MSGRLGMHLFRFEVAWTMSTEFEEVIKRGWDKEAVLPDALRELSIKLRAWNKSTFGNIFRRKRRNELRLGGGGKSFGIKDIYLSD